MKNIPQILYSKKIYCFSTEKDREGPSRLPQQRTRPVDVVFHRRKPTVLLLKNTLWSSIEVGHLGFYRRIPWSSTESVLSRHLSTVDDLLVFFLQQTGPWSSIIEDFPDLCGIKPTCLLQKKTYLSSIEDDSLIFYIKEDIPVF